MIAKRWWGGCLVGALSIGVSSTVVAQVVPDNTLGAESSVVTPDNIRGIESDRIDNGAIRGANLFHSFEQFNIGTGRGAYFTNPTGIENIFSRVTGANRSEILGRLGVLGNANLFLINPQGIVFGSAASLDVQGSFIATTADAVQLGDGGLFSATQPGSSNLLSVSPSAILFNTIAAQPILNRSREPGSIGQPNSVGLNPGLQVPPGRTLGLIGGNVFLEGGRLTAAGGRIELGSVAGVGEVSLTPNGNGFALGYDSINEFGDILLSNGAFVDASGEGGGDIQLRGARLEMTQSSNIWATTLGAGNSGEALIRTAEVVLSESSFLRADVFGTGTGGNLTINTGRLLVGDGAGVTASTYGEGKGGSLQIHASESVEVIGTSADGRQVPSGLAAVSNGSGDAGDLRIDTGRLLVRDGGTVTASNSSLGKGGSLQIHASESVEVIGTAAEDQFPSGLFVQSRDTASGDAGDLRIDTGRLLVSDAAQVSASTLGKGKGGSLQIHASESVEVIGTTADGRYSSGLSVQSAGSGDAGDLTINTRRLLVSDGAEVTVGTFGEGKGGSLQIHASESVKVIGPTADVQYSSVLSAQSGSTASGDAGDLTINTARLLVRDGAQVSASTLGKGKGGSLQIHASESVEVIGTTANGQFPSGLLAVSGRTASGRTASGNAGNLRIDTDRLLVRDGAAISSLSLGEGTAGNINITARETLQADNGTISTNTSRSAGGAIAIKAGDIRLFGDSDIISNVASGAEDGGAITLTADSILAFDDSNILAFARDGRGGDITFNTPAFFGENYRPASGNTDPDTLDNNNQVDINATGAVSGIIITPDVSFIQNSLLELPENQINTDSLLANSCIVRRNQPTRGSFTITGTGGLPQRPGDTQMSSFPTVDVETLPRDGTSSNTNSNRSWQKGDPIVEPQGVYRLPNGKLVLSRECS